MPLEIRLASPDQAPLFQSLASDPSLREHFESFQTVREVSNDLTHPMVAQSLTHVAYLDGAPAGFVAGYAVRPAGAPGWVYLRLGVVGSARRRGVARALLRTVARRALEDGVIGPGGEILLPVEEFGAEGNAFAERHGFRVDRYFWRMKRPRGQIGGPRWPEGIVLRPFDHSDRMFVDWDAVYEASFAGHYRPVPSTPALCREFAAAPDFIPDGLALAYRGEACVGFCRNETLGDMGIIGLLGVVPAERGIGLGRALLRWGVAYFSDPRWQAVGLGVDGDNETATALYHSEGFVVDRRRRLWAAVIDPLAAD